MPEETAQIILKASDVLSKKDFTQNFEKVIALILKMIKKQDEAIEQLFSEHSRLSGEFKNDYTSNLSELRKNVNGLFVESRLKEMDENTRTNFSKFQKFVNEAVEKKLREADERVASLKPIKGDRGDKGDAGPMPTEHLELMKEVKAELAKVKNVLANIPRGKGMGRAKVPIVRAVDLTSQVDGIVTTFTLQPDTTDVFLVWSSQFPIILRPTTDFTFAGRTLTLTSQVGVIRSGQTLTCLTESLFYP